jgi:hypothetical protein
MSKKTDRYIDPLQESIERDLMESELSYSAFLDDRHNQYTKAARKIRTKRRSLNSLPDTYSSESPGDSPGGSPEKSPNVTPRAGSPIETADRNIELTGNPSDNDSSNSSNSSDVVIVASNDYDPLIHPNIQVEDTACDDKIERDDRIDSRSKNETGSVVIDTRRERIDRMFRSTSPGLARFRQIDYGSDITSDDRGLLKEFGDSEVNDVSGIIRHAKRSPTAKPVSDEVTTMKRNGSIGMDLDAMLAEEIENCTIMSGIDVSNSSDVNEDSDLDIASELENEIQMSMQDIDTRPKRKKSSKTLNKSRESRGARRMMKWVNDESVDSCYGCSDTFTYIVNGKHHCRLCGRIFCQKCSRYKTVLPMDILKKIPDRPGSYTDFLFGEDSTSKVRVCADCFKYASDIIRIRKVIKVFELCGFNLIELNLLRDFNEDWRKAADFCIDRFREIQYKLSVEDLTPIEKKYIWANRYLLSGHSRWMVLLFKSCDMSDSSKVAELRQIMSSPKRVSCWGTKCSRFCSGEIQLGDMLDLVKYNNNDPVISEYIIECVSKIDGETLMDYLPFLVSNAVNNIFMIEILLDKARTNFTLMTHLYWCVKAFIPDKVVRRNSIIQALRFIKDRCDSSFASRFKLMIKNEKLSMEWIRLQNSEKRRKIIVPVCPARDFDSIDIDNIKIMDSYSRPVIIPFQTGTGEDKLIMYKEDDIRKDYVILGIINIIHRLLNDEVGMDIETVKYRVMPTSEDTGYIEIVENARTIYDIIQEQSIQNYILNHNQSAVVADIKDRFIKSTALYCVISYLFGFGDRHLENIMISEDGLLFHIDFGYILGQDPKYTTNKSLRVTPEIINVIGGQNTENYRRFSECCTQIYTCLRRHVNLFSNLLSVVPLIDPAISEEMIMHEIFDRFEVGENNLEAATHMDLKVRRDSGSFDYMIIDFLHRSKNSTFFKGIRYVTGVVFGAYSGGS